LKQRLPVILLILPLVFSLLLGCGKKANPVAPGMSIPAPVSDLQAWAKGEGIYLRWSMPSRNVDNSRLEDLLGFQVFRSERSLDSSSCPDCPLEPVGEIDVEYPRGTAQIDGNKVLWLDKTIRAPRQYSYFVLAYNLYKTPSPESNRITLFWDQPPVAPENLQVRSEDGALDLAWSFVPTLVDGKVQDLAGFNLYRRTGEERFGFFPLNPQPVPGREYLDGALENGRRYFYQVRAVRNFRGTLIEGTGSPVVSGVPEKRTAPAPPTGLIAVRRKEGVALRWNANAEPDITGYNVLRREEGEKEFRRVNPRLITDRYFLDETADPRKSYEYTVTAINSAGKESDSSQATEITPG
jgi:hypothetical protein